MCQGPKCMFKDGPIVVNISLQGSISVDKKMEQKIIDVAKEAAQLVESKVKWSSYIVRGALQ
jgi:hypothetical protein